MSGCVDFNFIKRVWLETYQLDDFYTWAHFVNIWRFLAFELYLILVYIREFLIWIENLPI